ncbi:MAG: cysteine--tRNA ligase, partial [Novosphingobium sp.]|nr:cysteine--tRNA ligase [Novosphingobium sp.]
SIATDYVPQMIEFAKSIAERHCYELESGLYFDVSTVADYGRLARSSTEEGESRIEHVEGKRHPADFAIWRKTPPGESRQMEWDSPWGRGAPGWHLECSVMSGGILGFPFDIHTGGIDHREIHHPNEIAQNQAYCCTNGLDVPDNSGARIWMHNNFLVERSGKMSKSAGEFLRLQLLIDRGFHPLAYRLMCLQAHYRSELEFSWEALSAALTRLKRLVMAAERLRAACKPAALPGERFRPFLDRFDAAISEDLNTPVALTVLEEVVALRKVDQGEQLAAIAAMDAVLGLNLLELTRAHLRIRPASAAISEADIEAALARRRQARAARDFAAADAIREALAARGVDVMDGDPLGWEWKLG